MKNKVDWFGYFFPVIRDIQEINRETDTEKVAKNNYRSCTCVFTSNR